MCDCLFMCLSGLKQETSHVCLAAGWMLSHPQPSALCVCLCVCEWNMLDLIWSGFRLCYFGFMWLFCFSGPTEDPCPESESLLSVFRAGSLSQYKVHTDTLLVVMYAVAFLTSWPQLLNTLGALDFSCSVIQMIIWTISLLNILSKHEFFCWNKPDSRFLSVSCLMDWSQCETSSEAT